MKSKLFLLASAALSLVAACSTSVESPTVTSNAGVHGKVGQEQIAVVQIKFDHKVQPPANKCPDLGVNCALTPKPKPPAWILSLLDVAIANGPSGTASFFSNSNDYWQYIAPDMDVSEATVFAQCCSGTYWMYRQDESSGTEIGLYFGLPSLPVDPNNASYKILLEK